MFNIGAIIAAAGDILDLTGRGLYDCDFADIKPQPNIRDLRLAFNNLSDPAILSLFPNAVCVDISGNEFRSVPANVHYKSFIASHNKLTVLPTADYVKADHNALCHIKSSAIIIDVGHNPLCELDAPNAMTIIADHCLLTVLPANKYNLCVLDISFNRIHEFTGHWPKLLVLNINGNKLETFTADLPKCVELHASDCGLLEMTVDAPQMAQADLSHNFLSNAPNWLNLIVLNMADNYVEILPNYLLLQSLDASRNNLHTVQQWPAIVHLDLSHNKFESFIGQEWSGLKYLDVSYCNIVSTTFADWPDLLYLNISHNKCHRSAGFRDWSQLSELRASYNELSDLSELYGKVVDPQFEKTGVRLNLKYVDISHNKYTSPLPEWRAEYIDVSHNKLNLHMIGAWICGDELRFTFGEDEAWKITSQLPDWPANYINISHNNLNIRLPMWQAQYINVSNNNFGGSGDRRVGHCTAMLPMWPNVRVVNMQYNNIKSVSYWPTLHYMLIDGNPITLNSDEKACSIGKSALDIVM